MKKQLLVFMGILLTPAFILKSQDGSAVKVNAGLDVYSSYIWRGTRLGTGPSLQPSVTVSTGGLTVGVWGAYDASGYMETDPYIAYAFPFGLSLGITDYYLPTLKLFDVSDSTGSHALELNAGLVKGGVSLSANYIINEAGGIASKGNDLYFQAGYDFKILNVSIGAGNGWHTSDGDFSVCHIGIGTAKEIKLTDSFSFPLKGQVILNPEREALYLVVGISL